MTIHPSSLGGQPLLDWGMGQCWAAPNCAGALPGSLVASVSYNTSCRCVKPCRTTLEDSEKVQGARPDVV